MYRLPGSLTQPRRWSNTTKKVGGENSHPYEVSVITLKPIILKWVGIVPAKGTIPIESCFALQNTKLFKHALHKLNLVVFRHLVEVVSVQKTSRLSYT